MITHEQIRWAGYSIYEGPFFLGTVPVPGSGASMEDKILATITATEGGRWNAINMYDRCICSVGAIQWCEGGQYSVSDMLGVAKERNPALLNPLADVMGEQGLRFAKNARGRWRFSFGDARGEVDHVEEQRAMFLLRSSGEKGDWDDGSKLYAKRWAAALASVYEQPEAIASQRDYTVPRLRTFALPAARALLDMAPSTPVGGVLTCAFLSFAANNPKWANESLSVARAAPAGDEWTLEWLVGILRELTFHPNITIYPKRYNAIRPVLERLFGVDLPDFAEELRGVGGEHWLAANEVQQILVDLGYDLGTSGPNHNGVDNAWGFKSKTALVDFQTKHDLKPDGMPDPETDARLQAARDALETIKQASGGTIPPELKAHVEALVTLSMASEARAYFDGGA